MPPGQQASATSNVPTTALITRDFNGSPIVFRADGWFNMTKAAQHFDKRLDKFFGTEETRLYLEELERVNPTKKGEYLEANRGRYGGTWAHPKLAVFFARWLDVRFSVWCDAVIEDILKGAAEVAIVKPEEGATRKESPPHRLPWAGPDGYATRRHRSSGSSRHQGVSRCRRRCECFASGKTDIPLPLRFSAAGVAG